MRNALIASCLSLLLSACGWHLRGSSVNDIDIDSVYVDADNVYGDIVSEMNRALTSSRITPAASPGAADYSIYLSDEDEDRRSASVGNDALVTEYELTLSTNYRIERGGRILVPTTRAEVSRTYEFDRNAMVAKAEEEQLILDEMKSALVQQILRRLRFLVRSVDSDTADQPAADGDAEP